MRISEIRPGANSKWLLVKASIWGFAFRVVQRTGIIERTIHSNKKKQDLKVFGNRPIWIITSVIKTKNTPFSYSRNRSIFSDEARFIQTKESISSIKLHSDHPIILVVEGSRYKKTHELVSDNVIVFLVRSIILEVIINGPFKGLGEAILLLLIGVEAESQTYIRKISGRYIVDQNIEKRPILFRELSGSAITISYGMSSEVFRTWQEFLGENLSVMSRGKSMEEVFLDFTRKNSFLASPYLGVSGNVAVSGGKIYV